MTKRKILCFFAIVLLIAWIVQLLLHIVSALIHLLLLGAIILIIVSYLSGKKDKKDNEDGRNL